MEQAVLSPDQQRWVSAVAKMTSLTYKGTLKWEIKDRLSPTDLAAYAERFPSNVFGVFDRYSTHFQEDHYLLTVNNSTSAQELTWAATFGLPKPEKRAGVSLQVLDRNGKTILQFPALSILNALADAVTSQVDTSADVILSEIENAPE